MSCSPYSLNAPTEKPPVSARTGFPGSGRCSRPASVTSRAYGSCYAFAQGIVNATLVGHYTPDQVTALLDYHLERLRAG
ncbi:hypothetical protein ACLQ2R_27050 [Streptosporangium sp. DT93]|uniref:hypothetical protein n=1 Tax=Streptosporangium sp. DT93 TaxID=3393428 RepID=UPI003CECC6B7